MTDELQTQLRVAKAHLHVEVKNALEKYREATGQVVSGIDIELLNIAHIEDAAPSYRPFGISFTFTF